MTGKSEKRKPFFANINEDEFDLLTRFEGKYLIRVRAFSAMNLHMTYTHKQLAEDWGCDERTVRQARVGLVRKGFCTLTENAKKQYLTPTFKGGCGSFRSDQGDKSGSKRSADQNDPDHSDPQCGSKRSASADQNDPTALYIKKECIKSNVLKQIQENFATQNLSPSAPCEFSSPDLEITEGSSISEPTLQALEAIIEQRVTAKLLEASRSNDNQQTHSNTSTTTIQGQEGGKMELVATSPSTKPKPKAQKQKLPSKYTKFAEQDFYWPDHWSQAGKQALQTWVEYKRDTGKAVLIQSYQQLIKNYISDESGFILAVDNSIACGYQGLFKPSGQQLRETKKQQQQKAILKEDENGLLPDGPYAQLFKIMQENQ